MSGTFINKSSGTKTTDPRNPRTLITALDDRKKYLYDHKGKIDVYRIRPQGGLIRERVDIVRARAIAESDPQGTVYSFSTPGDGRAEIARQTDQARAKELKGATLGEAVASALPGIPFFSSLADDAVSRDNAAQAAAEAAAKYPGVTIATKLAPELVMAFAPVLGGVSLASKAFGVGARTAARLGGGKLATLTGFVHGGLAFDIPLTVYRNTAAVLDQNPEYAAQSFLSGVKTDLMLGGIASLTLGVGTIAFKGVVNSNIGKSLARAAANRIGAHIPNKFVSTAVRENIAHSPTVRSLGQNLGNFGRNRALGTKASRFTAAEELTAGVTKLKQIERHVAGLTTKRSASQIRATVKKLTPLVQDAQVVDDLVEVATKAEQIDIARKSLREAQILSTKVAKTFQEAKVTVPPITLTSKAADELAESLVAASQAVKGSSKVFKTVNDAAGSLSKSPTTAFKETLAVRDRLTRLSETAVGQEALGISKAKSIIDLELASQAGDAAPAVLRHLKAADRFEKARVGLKSFDLPDLDNPAFRTAVTKAKEDVTLMQQAVKDLGAKGKIKGQLIALEKKLEGSADLGIQAIHKMNRARSSLQGNIEKFAVESFGKGTAEELAEALAESALREKALTAHTIGLITKGLTTTRHGLTEIGIYTYRHMKTVEEKRAAFGYIKETILSATATPDTLMGALSPRIGKIAVHDPVLATHVAVSAVTAASYFAQHLPLPQDPLLLDLPVSSAEIEEFLERYGAIDSPATVLASALDGSIQPQAVDALATVLPAVYAEMQLDLIERMGEIPADASYNLLIGLDTFLGGALGILHSHNAPLQPLAAQTAEQASALGNPGNAQPQNAFTGLSQTQRLANL